MQIVIFFSYVWGHYNKIKLKAMSKKVENHYILQEGEKMKEELENLGIKLAERYDSNYMTITYVDRSIMGNEDPEKDKYISIYLDEKEVEERCLKEQN